MTTVATPLRRRHTLDRWSLTIGFLTLLFCGLLAVALIAATIEKIRTQHFIQSVGVDVDHRYYGEPRLLVYEAILLGGGALNAIFNALLGLALFLTASPVLATRWLLVHRLYARGQLLMAVVALVLWIALQRITRTPMSGWQFSLLLAACVVSMIYPAVLLRTLPTNDVRYARKSQR